MRRVAIVVVLGLLALAAGALAGSPESVAAQEGVEVTGRQPECVAVRAEARMQAYGFDHLVTVRNACDRTVTCTVRTSVNPSPTVLQLEPGTSRDTLTWRGSPASTFTANVDCTAR